jgi:hypothetical protein
MTQGITTLDQMREELKKVPGRLPGRMTLSGICKEARSSTVAEFANRSSSRKGVTLTSLFDFFAVTGHELVATRPDMEEVLLRSNEDVKGFLRHLAKLSGVSMTLMAERAGCSLGMVTWVTGSSGKNTISLEPFLRLLSHEGVVLRLRKILPMKSASRRL